MGKRSLDRAITLYNKTYPGARINDTFVISYRPYYLNYVTPESEASSNEDGSATSVPRSELAEIKLKGMSQEKRDALQSKMSSIGQASGINFKYGGMIGRTKDAHRLVHLAATKNGRFTGEEKEGGEKEAGVTDQLVEGILAAFHEEERDIADRKVLREIAVAAGMGADEVDEAFSLNEVGEIVDAEAEKYRAMLNGGGVPTYFVGPEQMRIDGSQDPSDWFEMFVNIKEKGNVGSLQGTVCS